MYKIKGIIHAAGILRDSLFQNLKQTDFEQVYKTKVTSAHILDKMTRHLHLDFFILCSSVASALGNTGQTNYSFSNSSLDTIAHERHNLGITATSIQWGAWDLDGDGMAGKDIHTKLETIGLGAY